MLQNDIQLEYKQVGSDGTNVIFFNGFRMKFSSWDLIYPQIAKNHRVLLFNRYGVGASPKATVAQTGNSVVQIIHGLLSKLAISPPYFFVAHSLGGIFANLYARTYPNQVSGIVFVDASYPLEIAEQKMIKSPFFVRVVNDGLKRIEKLFDQFKYSEDECIEKTIVQLENAPCFPDIPIGVVSGTKKMPFVPAKAYEIHQAYQTKLLELSSNASHYVCSESGHFPQITEPEKVISAIIATLREAQNNRSL